MTLDEAIKHAEEVAEEKDMQAGFDTNYSCYQMSDTERNQCKQCAKEHRQLVGWLKELKQLREQTQWVPVSEGLPEDGQGVLFSIKTEKVYSGIYHKNNKINQWNSANHWYSHQDRSDSRNRAVSANTVIAWMPLPSSYQGE